MYRALDPEKIVSQLEQLERRINERFPEAGLARVCAELNAVARESHDRVERIGQRNWPLRISVLVLLVACAALIGWIGRYIDLSKTTADSVYTLIQGIEATMNIIVLMGVAVLFLVTFEERLKRRRAVAAIHELRSIVHVIDMHQLTKDPGTIVGQGRETASSPKRSLTPFQLARYLDYCSEMLSLTAKVAALYAQSLPDPVVASSAHNLELMTANLSNKIWQKINIVQAMIASLPTTSVPVVPRQVESPKPAVKPDAAPPRRPGG